MKALIFDYDGLMVDTETCAAHVVVELLAERGVEIELTSITPFVGVTGSKGQLAWEGWIRNLLGNETDPAAFDELVTNRLEPLLPELPLLPGVSRLIHEARSSGWHLGIATSHPRASLKRSLRRLGIHRHFGAIVTAKDVPHPKPAPDVFLEAAKRLQVHPHNCVALEDSRGVKPRLQPV